MNSDIGFDIGKRIVCAKLITNAAFIKRRGDLRLLFRYFHAFLFTMNRLPSTLIRQFFLLLLSSWTSTLYGYDLVVAQDGSGDYLTVQAAINAAPSNSATETIIFIKNGIYKEKILIPSSKTHLTLLGEDVDLTILTYDDYSGKIVDGITIGTSTSYSFQVDADYFKAENLSFENSAVQEAQAVAVLVNGDKSIFYHCKMLGNQDTYYTKGYGRTYVKDCYIEGTTDFIFGRSVVVFDSCLVMSKKNSYLTAASTEEDYAFGYVFFDCQLARTPGIAQVFLGRPWRPFARTVWIRSYLDMHVAPAGWSEWSGNTNHETCFYAEYQCVGPRALRTYRKPWSHELTAEEAEAYTIANIFAKSTAPAQYSDDWMPVMDSLPYLPYVNLPNTTSLDELLDRYELKVYPNPADSNLFLEFSLQQSTDASLKLYDQTQRLVHEYEAQRLSPGEHSLSFQLPPLPGGQYFYLLQLGEEALGGKFQIQY